MKAAGKIIGFLVLPMVFLWACAPGSETQKLQSGVDSLLINARCISTVAKLIKTNFLVPGQKKVSYKIDYISETWPDTITKAQAAKLVTLNELGTGFEGLLSTGGLLEERSGQQIEQLKKLNAEINSGTIDTKDMALYLTFESKCADTLNRVLDSLVKRSIELSCKSQSL